MKNTSLQRNTKNLNPYSAAIQRFLKKAKYIFYSFPDFLESVSRLIFGFLESISRVIET